MSETGPEGFAEALAASMRRRFGNGAELQALSRVSGGASQELWAFDVAVGGTVHPLILRRNPPGVPARATAAGMETEARMLTQAGEGGVPVPKVAHVFTADEGLGVGFVMERIAGETIARKILRDPDYAEARPHMAAQCGRIFARIHALDRERAAPLRTVTAVSAAAQARASYEGLGVRRPVVEYALRWLERNMPSPPEVETVLHGEMRNGNLIVGPQGVRAVLDWEVVHFGDPMEDLGWICVTSWRFGEIDKPVGGFGRREDMFAAYEAESGRPVDPERVRWWETLGTLRWGLTCAGMAAEFKAGDRSVERAAIGRRASETELDLLTLLLPREAGHA